MTDKDKYMIELFDKYNEILEHCNKPCKNMFSKDEFWTRHNVFKELQKEVRSYSFMIFMQNLKQNIKNFFAKFKRKRKDEPTAQIAPTIQDGPNTLATPMVPTEASEPTAQSEASTQNEPTEPAEPTAQTESNIPTESTAQTEQTVIKKRRGRKRKI